MPLGKGIRGCLNGIKKKYGRYGKGKNMPYMYSIILLSVGTDDIW
jgi:hypothetical protein